MKAKSDQLQYNRNGIPINRYVPMALLQVMGVDDPFEGRRCNPQFEDVRSENGEVSA